MEPDFDKQKLVGHKLNKREIERADLPEGHSDGLQHWGLTAPDFAGEGTVVP